MAGLSRRGLLASVGAAVTAVGLAPAGASAAAPRTFTLIGADMKLLGPRGAAVAGAPITVRGTVRSPSDDAVVGEFFAHGTVLAEHRLLAPELGRFETHLFRLGADTLTGTGTVHQDGHGEFTITGGSGRFTHARGSYRALLDADHSGTGRAEFRFAIG